MVRPRSRVAGSQSCQACGVPLSCAAAVAADDVAVSVSQHVGAYQGGQHPVASCQAGDAFAGSAAAQGAEARGSEGAFPTAMVPIAAVLDEAGSPDAAGCRDAVECQDAAEFPGAVEYLDAAAGQDEVGIPDEIASGLERSREKIQADRGARAVVVAAAVRTHQIRAGRTSPSWSYFSRVRWQACQACEAYPPIQLTEQLDSAAAKVEETEGRVPTRCSVDEEVVQATGSEECEVAREILAAPGSGWLRKS